MTTIKILSAGLVVAAVLTTPIEARVNYMTMPHATETEPHNGHLWFPVPPVKAFGAAHSNQRDGICDFGDNPMIC